MQQDFKQRSRRPGMFFLRLSLAFILVVAFLGFGCAQPDPTRTLTEEELAAVREANLAYPEAWLADDPGAVRAALTADAVLMPSGGVDPIEGMSEINQFFWPSDAPVTQVTEFSMQPQEIGGSPTQAFARGLMSLQFDLETETTIESYRTSGTYFMRLRPNDEGQWSISHYMWNHPAWQVVASRPKG